MRISHVTAVSFCSAKLQLTIPFYQHIATLECSVISFPLVCDFHADMHERGVAKKMSQGLKKLFINLILPSHDIAYILLVTMLRSCELDEHI